MQYSSSSEEDEAFSAELSNTDALDESKLHYRIPYGHVPNAKPIAIAARKAVPQTGEAQTLGRMEQPNSCTASITSRYRLS